MFYNIFIFMADFSQLPFDVVFKKRNFELDLGYKD